MPRTRTPLGWIFAAGLNACGPQEDPSHAVAPDRPEGPAVADMASTSRPQPRPLSKGLQPAVRELARGRYAQARELARAFCEENPNEAQGDFFVGLTFEKAGNYAAAVPWFESALRKSPEDFLVHDYLGRSLFLLGRLQEARNQFSTHARFDPLEPKPVYGLGQIELEEAQLEAAERTFRRALALFERLAQDDPRMYTARASERAECHARLADVYFARDRYEEARQELETATRLAPQMASAYHALSLVYRRLGEDAKADAAARFYDSRRQARTSAESGR